jgi:hypothetical protein
MLSYSNPKSLHHNYSQRLFRLLKRVLILAIYVVRYKNYQAMYPNAMQPKMTLQRYHSFHAAEHNRRLGACVYKRDQCGRDFLNQMKNYKQGDGGGGYDWTGYMMCISTRKRRIIQYTGPACVNRVV